MHLNAANSDQSSAPEPAHLSTPKSPPVSTPAPILGQQISNEMSPREAADKHARLLLHWLALSLEGANDRTFTVDDIQVAYGEMCAKYGLWDRPWNPVAASLSKLLYRRGRPRKTYRWRVGQNGKNRRLRFYEIPLRAVVDQ
jgi:hypothetical protein